MSNLNDKLCAYGVDFTEVMERFLNDEELFYDCLHSFIDDSAFAGLESAVQAKEYEAAFDYAHTLKGVAANLGVTPLLTAIIGIVEPLRRHEYGNLRQLCDMVRAEREKLREIIEE